MPRYTGPKEALDAAQSPDTGPELLRDLATSSHAFVRAAVAARQSAEPDVLQSLVPSTLVEYGDLEIALALADNPSTPGEALQALAQLTADRLGLEPHTSLLYLATCLSRHAEAPLDGTRALVDKLRILSHRPVVPPLPAKPSVLELAWSVTPPSENGTDRRFRDFVIDGVPLTKRVPGLDYVSPFGWESPEVQIGLIDRLIGAAPPDYADRRDSLYICAACGDLGCGAFSAITQHDSQSVIWKDFGLSQMHPISVELAHFEHVGPFLFERQAYLRLFERLREDVLSGA